VFLVGPDVPESSGASSVPRRGEIVLAAGKSVELVSEGSTPFVTVATSRTPSKRST